MGLQVLLRHNLLLMTKPSVNTRFYTQIVDLLQAARNSVVRAVNQNMVLTYFEIGRKIVEEEQNGKERAEYGKQLVKELSNVLTSEFGKGFSKRNLEQMRQFYLTYSKILLSNIPEADFETLPSDSEATKAQTLSAKFQLSWSHYLVLMRIDENAERKFYEIEAYKNNWSIRELQRQYDSALYTRLILSRDKNKVKELSEKGLLIEKPKDAIKDPYILEFLGLPEHSSYSETELEEQIIN